MDILMREVPYSATEDYLKVELAKILHKAPFPRDPLLNFEVTLLKKHTQHGKNGILTLPSEKAGRMFLHAYGNRDGLKVKGRKVKFRLNDRPLDEERVAILRSRPWKGPQQLRMEMEQRKQRIREGRPYPLKSYAFGRFAYGCFSSEFVAEGSADIDCDLRRRLVRFTLRKQGQCTADSEGQLVTLVRDLEIQSLTSTTIASYPLNAIDFIVESGAGEEPIIFIEAKAFPTFATETRSGGNDHIDTRHSQGLIPDVPMPPGCFSLACTFADEGDKEAFIHAARSRFHLRCFLREVPMSQKMQDCVIPTDDSLNTERVAILRSRPWGGPQQVRMEKEQRIEEGRPYPLKSYAFGRFADGWFSSDLVAEGSADIVCDLERCLVRFTLRKQGQRTADSDDRLVTLMRDLEIQPLTSTTIASYPLNAIDFIVESGAAEEPIIFIRANTFPTFATETHSAGNDHIDTQHSQGLIHGVPMLPGCQCFSLACTFADEGDKDAFIYAARTIFHLRYFSTQATTSQESESYEIPTDDSDTDFDIDDEVPFE